jgi:hypothetical protein
MYSVKIVPLGTPRWGLHRELPAWVTHSAVISGQHLGTMGIALPPLLPESSVILHLETVPQ